MVDKTVEEKVRETLEKIKIQSISYASKTVLGIVKRIIDDGRKKKMSSVKILNEVYDFANRNLHSIIESESDKK